MPRGEGKRRKQETWQVGWKKRTKEPRGIEPVCVGCAPFLSFSPYLPRLWQIGLGSCTFSSFCLFLLLLSFIFLTSPSPTQPTYSLCFFPPGFPSFYSSRLLPTLPLYSPWLAHNYSTAIVIISKKKKLLHRESSTKLYTFIYIYIYISDEINLNNFLT